MRPAENPARFMVLHSADRPVEFDAGLFVGHGLAGPVQLVEGHGAHTSGYSKTLYGKLHVARSAGSFGLGLRQPTPTPKECR
jgi:hypothetical protein